MKCRIRSPDRLDGFRRVFAKDLSAFCDVAGIAPHSPSTPFGACPHVLKAPKTLAGGLPKRADVYSFSLRSKKCRTRSFFLFNPFPLTLPRTETGFMVKWASRTSFLTNSNLQPLKET